MTIDDMEERSNGHSRRNFLGKAGLGLAGFAAGSAVLAACSSDDGDSSSDTGSGDTTGVTTGGTTTDGTEPADTTADEEISLSQDLPELEWEMATSWPTALITLFGSAQTFADQVSKLTGGKFIINPRPAGEIVGGLEVLPTVRDLGVESGHTASYYYVGLNEVQQFATAVPFGLTQRQQNAWMYEGGGLEILNEYNAEENGIIAFPCGGTGCQMGGWFSKEINTVDDLQGLKMRIPGLAGQVLTNLGGEQISIAGGEILPAIETGAIDAAEFVGPTDDLILGLDGFEGQLFYYHPGWWEPGTAVEVEFPLELWNDLPAEYQAAIENAAAHTNIRTIAKYDVLNPVDLQKVKEFAEIREFSPEIMAAFKEETEVVLDDVAAGNAKFAEILGPWREYRDSVAEWHGLAEKSYLNQQTEI